MAVRWRCSVVNLILEAKLPRQRARLEGELHIAAELHLGGD